MIQRILSLSEKETRLGFTLIELLIVVMILTILTGTIFSDYGSFSTQVLLNNLAHQVAIFIRQAQVYSSGMHKPEFASKGFGAYFSTQSESDKKKFVLFVDTQPPGNPDKIFSDSSGITCGSVGSECLEQTFIQSGDVIDSLCGSQTGQTNPCTLLQKLHIVFIRPNLTASIIGYDGFQNRIYTNATITLKSPKGLSRSVVVWSTGQILVQ